MRSFKIVIFISLICTLLTACSSLKRTKWTDKNMRVAVDCQRLEDAQCAQLKYSIVNSGAFTVVDRDAGMIAIQKEQERLHRKQIDRFDDKEKWAFIGKMYGVGSVIIANVQCQQENNFWNMAQNRQRCQQNLAMIDTNTGEVLVAVRGESTGTSSYDRSYMVPEWDDTVSTLVDKYPKKFMDNQQYEKSIVQYQAVSKEHAIRQKEEQAEQRRPSAVNPNIDNELIRSKGMEQE
ncbi:hypothetical protein [Bdellovibrio sp.]|uniref:hypothetical protein n=1 Tax=Bdellovibrio sp. TaxID=28201 RepID=UPI003222161D